MPGHQRARSRRLTGYRGPSAVGTAGAPGTEIELGTFHGGVDPVLGETDQAGHPARLVAIRERCGERHCRAPGNERARSGRLAHDRNPPGVRTARTLGAEK